MGESVKQAVIDTVACPRFRCSAPIGSFCLTKTTRNHTERVHAAIKEALKGLARDKGATDPEIDKIFR